MRVVSRHFSQIILVSAIFRLACNIDIFYHIIERISKYYNFIGALLVTSNKNYILYGYIYAILSDIFYK